VSACGLLDTEEDKHLSCGHGDVLRLGRVQRFALGGKGPVFALRQDIVLMAAIDK